MSEGPPKSSENIEDTVKKFRALAFELVQHERFPFPGIDPEAYLKLRATDEEFPGFCTPIDMLLERFKNEGIKVVLSPEHPESGNVFIVPSQSDDVENDSILPRDLLISEGMDGKLKYLISLSRIKA